VSKYMNVVELVVGGMTSRRGVREVTSRLRDVPGVERVTANPAHSLIRLSGPITHYRSVVQRGA
jgi:copper chaperone CopZ